MACERARAGGPNVYEDAECGDNDGDAERATLEEEVHRLPGSYYENIFDVFNYAHGLEDNEQAKAKGWRDLGRLLAWDVVGPKWLEDVDSAHLALWAVRNVLGVSAKDLAYILGVSKGRISQFMKPSEQIPERHRLMILGILDRAIDEWSSEVRVEYRRQKLIRAVRTRTVELLKTIRDAESEALFPSTVSA